MRVLHLSTSDGGSGAGIAANRIHQAVRSIGLDSTLLVQHQTTTDPGVVSNQSLLKKAASKLRPRLDKMKGLAYPDKEDSLFSPAWIGSPGLVDKINGFQPDLVHLHWVNFGFLKIEQIAEIEFPMLWTLHDNWAFTGGCHIMWDCEKYRENCGACPRLGSKKENDLSRKVWQRKNEHLGAIDRLSLIAPSLWLKDCTLKSSLFSEHSVYHIPNPIDSQKFKSTGASAARKRWKLNPNKKVLLYGALAATSDTNKGYGVLMKALRETDLDEVQIVVFGADRPEQLPKLKAEMHYTGQLDDHEDLIELYSAANVMIVPSRQEAFGQTAAEALACGTAVVAFRHTGLVDIIDHMENGYLAQPMDASDLSRGIEFVLNADHTFAESARDKVLREFESVKVAKQYQQVYKKVLGL